MKFNSSKHNPPSLWPFPEPVSCLVPCTFEVVHIYCTVHCTSYQSINAIASAFSSLIHLLHCSIQSEPYTVPEFQFVPFKKRRTSIINEAHDTYDNANAPSESFSRPLSINLKLHSLLFKSTCLQR